MAQSHFKIQIVGIDANSFYLQYKRVNLYKVSIIGCIA